MERARTKVPSPEADRTRGVEPCGAGRGRGLESVQAVTRARRLRKPLHSDTLHLESGTVFLRHPSQEQACSRLRCPSNIQALFRLWSPAEPEPCFPVSLPLAGTPSPLGMVPRPRESRYHGGRLHPASGHVTWGGAVLSLGQERGLGRRGGVRKKRRSPDSVLPHFQVSRGSGEQAPQGAGSAGHGGRR